MGSSTSPIDKALIGRRLATVRTGLKLSQGAFAEAVGVSKRSYVHYERGEREAPAGLIKAIYDQYGIDPVWLMSGDEIEPKVAGSPEIDFALINGVVGALDDELGRLGRQMRPEHRTRVIRALYQVALEQGRISQELVTDVVALAVARGR
ncbi:helix-turn-helix domain-containing protein [Marilutibacter spongiae]|uniref:Helix-turn-helix transcriptional regulator n=1 Tax=Marilutibacter spongiae TaxID=2025720 RepID=A0A7W3TJ29_9GAMM|nr:helix-turn-helix transcriptional regulator [Lysobacter spongiae]MBB1059270.1 helix-turn-helix transcriptional regulator [Lysobacter spongiae]